MSDWRALITPQKATLDSLRTLSWFVSYRRLSSQFQFSLSAVTLEYLSQWVQSTMTLEITHFRPVDPSILTCLPIPTPKKKCAAVTPTPSPPPLPLSLLSGPTYLFFPPQSRMARSSGWRGHEGWEGEGEAGPSSTRRTRGRAGHGLVIVEDEVVEFENI
jgi:hypothetical protein